MNWLFKRKSGNGTWAPQYIYLLYNVPYWYVTKIGVTGSPANRLRSFREDTQCPGEDAYLFKVKVFGAYYIEQFLHRVFRMFRIRWSGTGKTERFLIIVAPIAIAFIVVFKAIDVIKFPLVLFLFIYLYYIAS